VLIKTRKDILCGGFSSIPWKNSGSWTVDNKCFIFSLKIKKLYKRLNDTKNLYFGQGEGPWFGNGANLGIYDNKLYSFCKEDPFEVPKNA
jgi:TLD